MMLILDFSAFFAFIFPFLLTDTTEGFDDLYKIILCFSF